jgi:hypothetical protein
MRAATEVAALALLAVALAWAPPARAAEPAAKPAPAVVQIKGPAKLPTRSWFGLNVGIVSGSVDVPCGGVGTGCSEGGVLPTLGANFTVTGRHALRLRVVRAEEDNTRHKPYELAALVGTRLGKSHWYGLVGAGRMNHPDDEHEASVTGLAWEFVRARPTADDVGFEFAVQGNTGGEADFWGVAVGARFGKLR